LTVGVWVAVCAMTIVGVKVFVGARVAGDVGVETGVGGSTTTTVINTCGVLVGTMTAFVGVAAAKSCARFRFGTLCAMRNAPRHSATSKNTMMTKIVNARGLRKSGFGFVCLMFSPNRCL